MSGSSKRSVVFGASGVVGEAIVRLLSEEPSNEIAAVSRSGNVPALACLRGVTCVKGDALNGQHTVEICRGADVIYGCIGLPYSSRVWEKEFPVIIDSLLKAAEETGAVFVWVDNLYMFGPETSIAGIAMKENSREFTEFGRKPAVRARMDKTMLEAADSGRCKVALVRGSDFYGPGVKKAVVGEDLWKSLLKGGRGVVFGDPKHKHAFTYVPDLARATVAVANAGPSAWGRAWHCPNAPAVPVADLVQEAARQCGRTTPAPISVIQGFMTWFLGLFMPVLGELREMSFVWDYDYLVDHSEFSSRFPDLAIPTSLNEGIRATVDWWRAEQSKSESS